MRWDVIQNHAIILVPLLGLFWLVVYATLENFRFKLELALGDKYISQAQLARVQRDLERRLDAIEKMLERLTEGD